MLFIESSFFNLSVLGQIIIYALKVFFNENQKNRCPKNAAF